MPVFSVLWPRLTGSGTCVPLYNETVLRMLIRSCFLPCNGCVPTTAHTFQYPNVALHTLSQIMRFIVRSIMHSSCCAHSPISGDCIAHALLLYMFHHIDNTFQLLCMLNSTNECITNNPLSHGCLANVKGSLQICISHPHQ